MRMLVMTAMVWAGTASAEDIDWPIRGVMFERPCLPFALTLERNLSTQGEARQPINQIVERAMIEGAIIGNAAGTIPENFSVSDLYSEFISFCFESPNETVWVTLRKISVIRQAISDADALLSPPSKTTASPPPTARE